MSINHYPSVIKDNLELYLDANNPKSISNPEAYWYDLSGNNNHCIWYNPTGVFADRVAYTIGTYGNYYNFQGNSSYGQLNNTISFTSGQTIMIGMSSPYPTSAGRRNIWNQDYAGEGTWTEEAQTDINYYWGQRGTGYSALNSGSNSTVETVSGKLKYMCVTRSPIEIKWYKNGQLLTSSSNLNYPLTKPSGAAITLGTGYTGVPWVGGMSQCLAWSRALSADEVLYMFNSLRARALL